MPERLQDKLARLIEQRLKRGKADLETLPNGHVCGHVISSEFEDKDYERRRVRIREMLDEALTEGELEQADLLSVSTLLTYTPEEWSVATTDTN